MMRALADLAPREVALAASKIDDGAHLTNVRWT
jgi:hypothetical protein